MFVVTLCYNQQYGYVSYDEATKKATVVLEDAAAKKAVEDFLAKPLELEMATGATIRDFTKETLDPLASLENFKNCLTRLWGATEVMVEWSLPVDVALEE